MRRYITKHGFDCECTGITNPECRCTKTFTEALGIRTLNTITLINQEIHGWAGNFGYIYGDGNDQFMNARYSAICDQKSCSAELRSTAPVKFKDELMNNLRNTNWKETDDNNQKTFYNGTSLVTFNENECLLADDRSLKLEAAAELYKKQRKLGLRNIRTEYNMKCKESDEPECTFDHIIYMSEDKAKRQSIDN